MRARMNTGNAAATHIRLHLLGTSMALAMLLLAACGGGAASKSTGSGAASGPTAVADARQRQDARIAFLEERAAGDPLDVFSLNNLAIEHQQRARETGDVSEIARAEDALRRSLKIRLNSNYDGIALLANVQNTKHEYAAGLALAAAAIPLKPKSAYGYGVLGDAYMGLGQYKEADFAYEKLIELSPDLSAFGRRAALFQTRGQIGDAEGSWQEAIKRAKGDGTPEHSAWAHAQIASFYFALGRVDDAAKQYQLSLDAFPGYVHALAGTGRVAAAQGDTARAIEYYTRAINAVPLPEYVTALGDVYASSGDQKNAQAQYDLIGAIEQLYAANGVNLDLQIGLFNADHDRNVAATVDRAKTAFAQQPSILAADVLAWVQFKAGNIAEAQTAVEQALSSGTLDPLITFHAGMIYKAAGDTAKAKTYLDRLEQTAPNFSVLYASTARKALEDVTAQARGS